MEEIQRLPIGWLSGAEVTRRVVQSRLLNGSITVCGGVRDSSALDGVKLENMPTANGSVNALRNEVLGKRKADLLHEPSIHSASSETSESDPSITAPKRIATASTINAAVENAQIVTQVLDEQQRMLDNLQENERMQMLERAIALWRQSRPDVVLLSPIQTRHRCENRLNTINIENNKVEDSFYRKAPSSTTNVHEHPNRQQLVLYGASDKKKNALAISDPPCQLTRLTVYQYRDGHSCVYDGDRRVRLCPDAQNSARHREKSVVWRDDTLYMCNTTGWVHRCGKFCEASVMIKSTQCCHTCPITGLIDTSRRMEINSFQSLENDSSGQSGSSDGGNSSFAGTNGTTAGNSAQSSSMSDNSEDSRLHRMYMRDGTLRRHGDTLMHQLSYTEVCSDWITQLVQCSSRTEIENYSKDYIRATMRVNRPVAYLMVIMCDLWLLLCPARRALELKRQKRFHANACIRADKAYTEHERYLAHFYYNQSAAFSNTSASTHSSSSNGTRVSKYPVPFTLMQTTTRYYAHVAKLNIPILPALDACVPFVKIHAMAVVQLWYVMHSIALSEYQTPNCSKEAWCATDIHHANASVASSVNLPGSNREMQSRHEKRQQEPLSSVEPAPKQHHPRRPWSAIPPKGSIPIAKFVLPALHVLAEGVVCGALFEGQVDQVLVAARPALSLMLPCGDILQNLCGATNTTCFTLVAQIKHALIDAVQSGRCSAQMLDFSRIPFEHLDASRFFSLDLRERTTSGKP